MEERLTLHSFPAHTQPGTADQWPIASKALSGVFHPVSWMKNRIPHFGRMTQTRPVQPRVKAGPEKLIE